jgi:predicted metal-dependent phosphoesterase TrpH
MTRAMDPHRPVGRADLHVHPLGDGTDAATPGEIYAALVRSQLDVAVLADHDRIDVAADLVARSRDEGAAITLVVGEEISTHGGHVVGVGLTTLVPPWMALADAIAAVHDQGGIAVIAHPLLPGPVAASAALLVQLAEGDPRRRPDAVEAMHPTGAWIPGWQNRVEGLARRCGYAVVGGSDAHRARAVGRGLTLFHGATTADLEAAIHAHETWTEGRRADLRDIFRRRRPNPSPGR